MPETLAQLRFKAKELKKLSNKESQPALKSYYQKQAAQAKLSLKKAIANDSAYKCPRSALTRLPQVKWEPLDQ